jgi:hypothetical protein
VAAISLVHEPETLVDAALTLAAANPFNMNVRGSRDKDGSYLDDPKRDVRSEKVWAVQRAW